jgi:hypothetical protein
MPSCYMPIHFLPHIPMNRQMRVLHVRTSMPSSPLLFLFCRCVYCIHHENITKCICFTFLVNDFSHPFRLEALFKAPLNPNSTHFSFFSCSLSRNTFSSFLQFIAGSSSSYSHQSTIKTKVFTILRRVKIHLPVSQLCSQYIRDYPYWNYIVNCISQCPCTIVGQRKGGSYI